MSTWVPARAPCDAPRDRHPEQRPHLRHPDPGRLVARLHARLVPRGPARHHGAGGGRARSPLLGRLRQVLLRAHAGDGDLGARPDRRRPGRVRRARRQRERRLPRPERLSLAAGLLLLVAGGALRDPAVRGAPRPVAQGDLGAGGRGHRRLRPAHGQDRGPRAGRVLGAVGLAPPAGRLRGPPPRRPSTSTPPGRGTPPPSTGSLPRAPRPGSTWRTAPASPRTSRPSWAYAGTARATPTATSGARGSTRSGAAAARRSGSGSVPSINRSGSTSCRSRTGRPSSCRRSCRGRPS